MNANLQSFYERGYQWLEDAIDYDIYHETRFLRHQLTLFDLTEWWIFKETMKKDLPLHPDEEAWLSIPREDRVAILWVEEGMY